MPKLHFPNQWNVAGAHDFIALVVAVARAAVVVADVIRLA
jgi:hypothetical protein